VTIRQNRKFKDKFTHYISRFFSNLIIILLVLIALGLFIKAFPILQSNSLKELLFSSEWMPFKHKFGLFPFILSTVLVTLIAITIALPLSILTAIYLTEFARKKVLSLILPFIDILAGLPSVIYGIWGVIFIVPIIKNNLAPLFNVSTTGYSLLAGGVVLAIMIIPIIIHVTIEVLKNIPNELKEASLSLGATYWETIKFVVLRKALPGIIAAAVLGVSRAFGETLAVLMVVGNVVQIPTSLFDSAYPLPALIANNYGEMMSIPMYDSALMFAAFILLLIIVFFNIISRMILMRIEKKYFIKN